MASVAEHDGSVECATRLATEDDLPVLAIFERELARSAFPDDPIMDLSYHHDKLERALRAEPEGMVVMVATGADVAREGEVAGWLWLSSKRTLATGERYGVVRSIYVRERFRSRGIADDLAGYALRYFRGRGVARVVAKVHHENAAGLKVLRDAGFKDTHLTLERRVAE